MKTAMELTHVHKSFLGVHALNDVSIRVEAGRVHALVGENGAGKSTLIKIAAGVIQPDRGSIVVAGDEVSLTPRSAREYGIRVVHQERQVALSRTVAENLVLDAAATNRFGFVTRSSMRSAAQERLDRIGLSLDLDAPVSTLTVAQTQLLEIARAVTYDANCIILDEPTASLHRSEIGGLFDVIRAIRNSGVAVVYISHHLDEVMAIADDYTVLRDGNRIEHGTIGDTTPSKLVRSMFGEDVSLRREEIFGDACVERDVATSVRGVSLGTVVRDVSFEVHSGEVVVVTGPVGSGAEHLGRMIAGAQSPDAGEVRIGADRITGRRHATRAGVAYLPADRKRLGLMLDRSIAENLLLAEFAVSRKTMFASTSAASKAQGVCRSLAIKFSDVRLPVKTLSGGNQQRVVLGRWLNVGSTVLVLDEPTVGVDIPSKAAIYKLIRERARAGAAIVILSTEYQEIRCVADRVIVMRDGRIQGQIPGSESTESRIFELELKS